MCKRLNYDTVACTWFHLVFQNFQDACRIRMLASRTSLCQACIFMLSSNQEYVTDGKTDAYKMLS